MPVRAVPIEFALLRLWEWNKLCTNTQVSFVAVRSTEPFLKLCRNRCGVHKRPDLLSEGLDSSTISRQVRTTTGMTASLFSKTHCYKYSAQTSRAQCWWTSRIKASSDDRETIVSIVEELLLDMLSRQGRSVLLIRCISMILSAC